MTWDGADRLFFFFPSGDGFKRPHAWYMLLWLYVVYLIRSPQYSIIPPDLVLDLFMSGVPKIGLTWYQQMGLLPVTWCNLLCTSSPHRGSNLLSRRRSLFEECHYWGCPARRRQEADTDGLPATCPAVLSFSDSFAAQLMNDEFSATSWCVMIAVRTAAGERPNLVRVRCVRQQRLVNDVKFPGSWTSPFGKRFLHLGILHRRMWWFTQFA